MAVEATPAAAPSPGAASGESGRTGANAQTSSPGPTPASSPSQSEQASRGPDYFREAFNRVRGQRQTVDQAARNQVQAPQAPPASQTTGPEVERSGAATQQRPRAPGNATTTSLPARSEQQQSQQQPETLTLTREQFARSVQSEVDRVLAKREADAQARKAKDEERQLRQDDPFEYVRRLEAQEAEAEQAQAKTRETIGYLEQQLHHYDRGVLDQIMGALPDKVRTNILKSVKAEGIPGRTELTKQGLKALQQYWQFQGRESAKSSLMKDERFVKEVLARYGGSPGEVDPTPSLPPAAAARQLTSNDAVNNWMRSSAAVVRTSPGRGR